MKKLLAEIGGLIKKNLLKIGIAILVLLFMYFVWPTRYMYLEIKLKPDQPIRVDRLTGKAEALTSEGWNVLEKRFNIMEEPDPVYVSYKAFTHQLKVLPEYKDWKTREISHNIREIFESGDSKRMALFILAVSDLPQYEHLELSEIFDQVETLVRQKFLNAPPSINPLDVALDIVEKRKQADRDRLREVVEKGERVLK